MSYTNKFSMLPYKLADGAFITLLYIVAGLSIGWISSLFYNSLNGGVTVSKRSSFLKDLREILIILASIAMLQILASSSFYYIGKARSLFFNSKLDRYGSIIILYTMIWALYHPQFKRNTETLLTKYLWEPENVALGIIIPVVLTSLVLLSTIL